MKPRNASTDRARRNVPRAKRKSPKVEVTMPPDLLARLDDRVAELGMPSRARGVQTAVEEWLDRGDGVDQ